MAQYSQAASVLCRLRLVDSAILRLVPGGDIGPELEYLDIHPFTRQILWTEFDSQLGRICARYLSAHWKESDKAFWEVIVKYWPLLATLVIDRWFLAELNEIDQTFREEAEYTLASVINSWAETYDYLAEDGVHAKAWREQAEKERVWIEWAKRRLEAL
jgi:hypothetical protein